MAKTNTAFCLRARALPMRPSLQPYGPRNGIFTGSEDYFNGAWDFGGTDGAVPFAHHYNGAPLMIDRTQVRAIRPVEPGEYADGVQSVVTIGKKRQGVRETVREATAAIGFI